MCKFVRGFVHIADLKDIMDGVARQFVQTVTETLDVAHIRTTHADGIGRNVGTTNEFVVDSRIDGGQVFAARVVVFGKHIRTLVEAIGEGHHGDIDEVFRDFGCGQTVEARVDRMVEDGTVLHRKPVNKIFKVMLRILVEQAERHGVKLAVEAYNAQIKAFLGWGGVFCFGLSATGEGGEGDNKCQNSHR